MTTEKQYFILTGKPEYPQHISPGRICYTPVFNYSVEVTKLKVIFVGSRSSLDYEIDISCMKQLDVKEAELLQALSEDQERLKWFKQRDALKIALTLTEGTAVTVEEGAEKLRGIIRYIGELTRPNYPDNLTGMFFGIELQGEDRGKGNTNGIYSHKTFFTCKKDCGIFAPFSRVRPLVPTSLSPSVPESSSQTETEELFPGDRVTYFINNYCRHGMVVDVLEKDGEQFVRISTDTDENGKTGGEVEVPLQFVAKGEVPAVAEGMDVDTSPVEVNADSQFMSLSVNSVVELALGSGNSYGIIRWIGTLPGRQETMAGLELVIFILTCYCTYSNVTKTSMDNYGNTV